MKRPYLTQFERWLLIYCSRTSHAETIRFRLARVYLKRAIKIAMESMIKSILKL